MSKRVKKFERFHRHSIHQYGLTFTFTTPSPNAQFGVTLVGGPVDDEKRSYEFIFDPQLEKIHAGSSYLTIMHIESKRKDTTITVLPKTEDKKFQEPFMLFPTHVCRTNKLAVTKMYLTIVNNQLRGDINIPIWNPHFNMQWFIGTNRYHALDFFDPDQSLELVDVSKIPQGSYITGKPSFNGITASRTGRLLGYYPGTNSDFSGWRAVSMRLGRLYEPLIATIYLNHHPDYKFKEVGFLSLENGSPIDGSQVDGIINDEFAVEFKSSKFNCDFEPVYISQCIMEMACGFPHIDLVKFCERQVRVSGAGGPGNSHPENPHHDSSVGNPGASGPGVSHPRNSLWATEYSCKEIRLYRNIELERDLITLCKESNALKGPKFDAIIQTEPFVNMRVKLEHLAKQCNENAKMIPVDLKLVERFKIYKQNILDIQSEDSCVLDPVLDRIEKRQSKIFADFQEEDKTSLVTETLKQIQDYTDILLSLKK